jgi:hypothetical protein
MVTNQKTIILRKLDVKPFDFYNKIDYHLPTIKNYDVKLFKYYELWKLIGFMLS